ncbi:MAG: cation diffusion facilitator family transporter [Cyclobacteriaceae bacterium]|nr:cation diffusion facilitator family transporter [Cyclobacteriaceae bacterium]
MLQSQTNEVYKQGIISIIANTLLFVIKYYVGIVSGSIALITDAWHTLSDSLSSLVIIIGTKISTKPADTKHPFGHGRIQLVSALILGILLSTIGFSFLSTSVYKLIDNEVAQFGNLAIWVTIVSILVKELLAQYSFYLARKTKQAVLQADGWHHRSDAISSIILLVGILVGRQWWWADGVLGVFMSLFIFKASYDILKEAITPLLGEAPSKETMNQVAKICSKIAKKEVYPHHFHLHNYGYHQELTFHIALSGDLSLHKTHHLADKIELEIRNSLEIEATIHIDPIEEIETQKDIKLHQTEIE